MALTLVLSAIGVVEGGSLGSATDAHAAAIPPTTGPLEGAFGGSDSPSGIASFASATDTSPTIATIYLPGSGGWQELTGAGNSLQWLFQNGWSKTNYTLSIGVPIIPTESNGTPDGTLAVGATGAYDAYFTTLAKTLVAAGESGSFLRIGWEFDGSQFPWSATTPAAEANYATYFQQIVKTMRAVPGANFKFIWDVLEGDFSSKTYNVALAYPGSAYVDAIGLDYYDSQTWVKPLTAANSWKEATLPYLTAARAFAAAQSEPLVIPEWGVESAGPHGLGDDPLFVQNFINWFQNPANDVLFASYFVHSASSSGGGSTDITNGTFPESLAAFTSLLHASAIPPTTGPLEGAFGGSDSPSGVASFASATGTKPTIATVFLPGSGGWQEMTGANNSLQWLFQDGWSKTNYTLSIGVPIIPTESNGTPDGTLAVGATGAYDAYFTTLAKTLIAAGESGSYLRLGWEFNGPLFPWEASTPAAEANYAAYFRQIVTTMRAVPGANFKFIWNALEGDFSSKTYNVALAYPGSAYVDAIGLDYYDSQTWVKPLTDANSWKEATLPYLTAARAFAAAQSEPLVIPEWGVESVGAHGLGDDPLFVQNFITWFQNPANDVLFASYFSHSAIATGGGTTEIADGSFPQSLAEFTSLLG